LETTVPADSRIALTLLALPIAWPVGAAAQWQAPTTAALQALADERVAAGAAAGLVIGVVDRGMPRFVTAGDLGGKAAPVFEIGSVSKVFTTTLLAEMVLRGEVALEDPVERHLPAGVRVPERNGKKITLLDLATATSGLPRVPDLEPEDPDNPYADFSADDFHAWLAAHTLQREPGAQWEYSNTGMGLLGHALAHRAGMTYEAAVRERVLRPLGMHETWIRIPESERARLVPGYDASFEPAGPWDFDVLAGTGGWRSTPEDMLRFLAAVISPPATRLGEAIRMATQSQRPTTLEAMSIGLGWYLISRGGRTVVWHDGQTGGYQSFVGFEPATGANVLLLTNTAIDNNDIAFHLLEPAIPLRTPAPRRLAVAVPADSLERLVGDYPFTPDFVVTVRRREDALFAQATGQPEFPIYPSAPLRFFYRVVDAELLFDLGPDGKAAGVTLLQGGQESRAARRVP
jgi:CubicO group peptidase (beta-lactamase class C family)